MAWLPFTPGKLRCCGCCVEDVALPGRAGFSPVVLGPGAARIIAEGKDPKTALLMSGRGGCAGEGPGSEGGAILGV